jgi:hypothetical protein
MVNIADVPFPFRSGREKDQVPAFQKEKAILPILFYDLEKGFRKLKFFL